METVCRASLNVVCHRSKSCQISRDTDAEINTRDGSYGNFSSSYGYWNNQISGTYSFPIW